LIKRPRLCDHPQTDGWDTPAIQHLVGAAEYEGTFRSWAVPKGPSLDPKDRRMAMKVEDHPLDYGDFEGTIPKGQYGGGTVMLWDRGYWAPEKGFEKIGQALAKGELKFVMEGERMHGSWVIVRT
jgi:bifunctional non-homologous end joining protein LigD